MKDKREVSNLVYNIYVLVLKSLVYFLQRKEFRHSELPNPFSYNSTVSSKFYINVQILGGTGEDFFPRQKNM